LLLLLLLLLLLVAGFAPVEPHGGDDASISEIINDNNVYLAVCAKQGVHARQVLANAAPRPEHDTQLPTEPNNAAEPTAPPPAAPAADLTADPAAAAAAEAANDGQGGGSRQPADPAAALRSSVSASEAALAASAAVCVVTAPELLAACKQHSTPAAKPWRM
jgi:hypothetical protein